LIVTKVRSVIFAVVTFKTDMFAEEAFKKEELLVIEFKTDTFALSALRSETFILFAFITDEFVVDAFTIKAFTVVFNSERVDHGINLVTSF